MGNRRLHIKLVGVVQGVGLRPFCKLSADSLGLKGYVRNRIRWVEVEVQGEGAAVDRFVVMLGQSAPGHPAVDHREIKLNPVSASDSFEILDSDPPEGTLHDTLSADRVPCEQCVADMKDQGCRRFAYPFTSCTQCGPRYGIIRDAPFDRATTSFSGFPLCDRCLEEYMSPENRRFHAQTICCPDCGPSLTLAGGEGNELDISSESLISVLATHLGKGAVVAVRSNSGFHFVVDPANSQAVSRLRALKSRPRKPFALMYPDLDTARRDCPLSALETHALTSPEGPLVLLSLHDQRRPGYIGTVAPGCASLAIMLPSSGLYHLLMADWRRPLIVTSANRQSEPLITTKVSLLEKFADEVDLIVDHDLDIVDGLDDSIVQEAAGKLMILRRARGYIPASFPLPQPTSIAASCGAFLKNTVACAEGDQMTLSRYLGDLNSPAVRDLQAEKLASFLHRPGGEEQILLLDRHPDFPVPEPVVAVAGELKTVQHHIAHAFSAELEHGIQTPYLAAVWDGLGYGDDGGLWGGEFFVVDDLNYQRIASLRPIALIGNELAFREPRRIALALLHHVLQDEDSELKVSGNSPSAMLLASLLNDADNQAGWDSDQQQWLKGMSGHWLADFLQTSSIGRLFDGIASLLNFCHINSYEAEAAMALQSEATAASTAGHKPLPFHLVNEGGLDILCWRPLVKELLKRKSDGVETPILALQFIQTLSEMTLAVARKQGLKRVVMAGGCFQNRLLLEQSVRQLEADGFDCYWPRAIPINDSGIAAGQIMAQVKATAMHEGKH
jgi:hydrogenase maturation protein HypF